MPDHAAWLAQTTQETREPGHNVVWNSFKRMVAEFSDHEKAAPSPDTVTAVYRL